MTAPELNERAAFEKWASGNGMWPACVERSVGCSYKLAATASKWDAWQGAWEARAAPPAQAELSDEQCRDAIAIAKLALPHDEAEREAAYSFVRAGYRAAPPAVGGEPVAWMVGDDAATAATYNASKREDAFDAARRWKCGITGLVTAPGAPALPNSAAAPAVGQAQVDAPVTLWLIERGQQENHTPTVWYVGHSTHPEDQMYGGRWTETAYRAVNFLTKQECETAIFNEFARYHGDKRVNCHASEHAALPQEAAPSATCGHDVKMRRCDTPALCEKHGCAILMLEAEERSMDGAGSCPESAPVRSPDKGCAAGSEVGTPATAPSTLTASTSTKLGSGPSKEGAVESDAAPPSATWTNAEIHAFLDASALDVAALLREKEVHLVGRMGQWTTTNHERGIVLSDPERQSVLVAIEREHARAEDWEDVAGNFGLSVAALEAKVAALEARLARVIAAADAVMDKSCKDHGYIDGFLHITYRAARDAP